MHQKLKLIEKYITRFGIPQQIVHDNGTAFLSNDLVHRTHEFGIALKPRTSYSPWTNGKVEVQNTNLANYLRSFNNDTGSNWANLTNKFAFAHNTAINYSTGYTPYEIVFGIKPQIPISLKLGLLRDNRRNCISEYCKDLPLHTHCENSCKNEKVDKLLQNRLSSTILQRENEFKNIYSKTYTRCRQIKNKAHEYRNRFKLGKPIKIGRKALLENHAKGLLKSKKLLELRSGPYTVTKQITNTTYEIVHDTTEQKKVVHRNHLVEYFPKEQEIDKLAQDYSTNYDESQAYYDRFNQHSINRFNHQTIDNPEYMPWPIINNAKNQAEQITSPQPVEYSTTVNTCRSAPNSPYKTNRNDSTLHIRNLFSPQSSSQSTTSNSHTFSPIISSTPHPVKIKTNPNPICSDVRPQRTRTEPKRYENTIPSDLIPKVQKK